MTTDEKIYRDLQEHLDKHTMGFPAIESGADIRLLKHLFTPEQAKAVLNLTYKFEPLGQIFERAKQSGISIIELETRLDECVRKGIISFSKKDDVKYYRTMHYLIGMAEGMIREDPSPEFIATHEEFTNEGFLDLFLNTKVSQMRVIPIEQSVTSKLQVGSYDELKDIIKTSDGPFAVLDCVCREGTKREGNPCSMTSRSETCMVFRDAAQSIIDYGIGRELSSEEALEILQKNEEDGLVLQPANTQAVDFICSCCGCCCGILIMQKAMPNPSDFWASNFYAEVNQEECTGCETCVDSCQVDAMKLNEDNIATVDLTRCIGCGNCVPTCPEEAIQLIKKEKEIVPPKTAEDLDEILVTNK